MVSSKRSPNNRRKSIAVISDQNKPAFIQRSKRRAHSVAPGELSPLAKARRLLVPRKSILKTSINIQPPNGSQSSLPTSQSSLLADENATQSMDMTNDFTTNIHDNTSRKSLGRRVSFAKTAKVRLFEIQGDHTSSTNASGSPPSSPQSSPHPSSDNEDPAPTQAPPTLSDENAYPGAGSRSGRRSSVRYSMAGSEDMDLTTIGPRVDDEFNFEDDNFDFNTDDDSQFVNDDGESMDVTRAMDANIIRRRTLSMGGNNKGSRQPLAELANQHVQPNDTIAERSMDSASDMSEDMSRDMSNVSNDNDDTQSAPMEFTVPINQGLRQPAHEDPAWLALRAVTHSGDTPYEPPPPSDDDDTGPISSHVSGDDMQLDDAMQRLMRARDSLPMAQSIPQRLSQDDDSFTSSEGSLVMDVDETVNVSKIIGRASIGGFSARPSLAFDSTMDGTSLYGNINAVNGFLPVESTPTQNRGVPQQEPSDRPDSNKSDKSNPPVFQPPTIPSTKPSNVFTPKPPTSPSKNTTTPRAASPAKPKPTFTAAFAPPTSRPSPKKPRPFVANTPSNSDATMRNSVKRTHSETQEESIEEDNEGPSSSRIAFDSNDRPEHQSTSANTERPPAAATVASTTKVPQSIQASSKPRLSSTIRRPSGYFSRRQSMGAGVLGPNNAGTSQAEQTAPTNTAQTSRPSSPKKPAVIGMGRARASMGSAASDAWMRFDRNAATEMQSLKGKAKQTEEVQESHEESPDQVVAMPSSRIAFPASPLPHSPALDDDRVSSIPLATLATPDGFGEADPSMDIDEDQPIQAGIDLEGRMALDANANATEQWIEGVEQQDTRPEENIPSISIAEFFQITGIKFMDELTAPRRSMSQPGRPERPASDISLSEYAIATTVDVPQLSLYTRVANDLEAWMKKSKIVMQETEQEAAKVMPELFTEYLAADEEGKDELRHQLTLIRTNARGLAKAEWYNWKLQWIEGLNEIAGKGLEELQSDAATLKEITLRAEEMLPSLEQEYAEVTAELEKEQTEVDEILASDQEYLNELKASIAEQDVEVEALRAELAESNAQLARLRERLQENEEQQRESEAAISSAKRLLHVQQSSTRSEILRLRDELEAMEDLHMFHATKVSHDLFEYVYASRYKVSIPCVNHSPIISKIELSKLDKAKLKYKDDYPHLSDYFLRTAKERLVQTQKDWTVRKVVQRISDYWSSCMQVRSQLDLLSVKYPVTIDIPSSSQSTNGFTVKTQLLYPSLKAKALVSFVFTPNIFASWPKSINQLLCNVEVAYGSAQKEMIYEAVVNRLSEASPEENHACLLDACIGAQDVYQ